MANVPKFKTMGQRAWHAYMALPRDAHGAPPPRRQLERDHGLANGTLRKLIWDLSKKPGYETVVRAASALGTTPEWLRAEVGPWPTTEWQIPPRPPLEDDSSGSRQVPATRPIITTTGESVSESRGVLRVSQRPPKNLPSGRRAQLPDKSEAARGNKKSR